MKHTDPRFDIVLIHIDTWMNCNNALAILNPVLKGKGIQSVVINSSDLEEYIDRADVFGISVMDHTYHEARRITRRLQEKTVIWGGWTPSALPEYFLQENPRVDYIVIGEGENRLTHLVGFLLGHENTLPTEGIAYRDVGNKIVVRPPEQFVDMDQLPFPDDRVVFNSIVYIELSRGCYGQCRYCQEIKRMRFKDPHICADEIQRWYKNGMSRFYIGGANSLANGPLLRELIKDLESRKLPVEICLVGRPEDVLKNFDIIENIVQSSTIRLIYLEVGIEANTRRVLDLLGRGTTPELNERVLNALKKLQADYPSAPRVFANMILFSHYDMTLEDFIENLKFIGKYKSSKDVISLSLCGVAGTPLWRDMNERGFKPDTTKAMQIHSYRFSDDRVQQLYERFVSFSNRQYMKSGKLTTFWDYKEVQNQIYTRLLEFYEAEDIAESLMSFIGSSKSKSITPVFIIEEHHEAFFIWSYARERGILPDTATTLVHVDEHSDMNIPTLSQSLNEIDKDPEGTYAFVQENLGISEFILPAAYVGFFDHVCWLRRHHPSIPGERTLNVTSRNGDGQDLLVTGDVIKAGIVNPERKTLNFCCATPEIPVDLKAPLVLDIDLDYFFCDFAAGESFEIEITEDEYRAFCDDPYHRLRLISGKKIRAERRGKRYYYMYQTGTFPDTPPFDEQEVEKRIDEFVRWLDARKIRPLLIDICRSRFSRYTPPERRVWIEELLLARLGELFSIECSYLSDIINPTTNRRAEAAGGEHHER